VIVFFWFWSCVGM